MMTFDTFSFFAGMLCGMLFFGIGGAAAFYAARHRVGRNPYVPKIQDR